MDKLFNKIICLSVLIIALGANVSYAEPVTQNPEEHMDEQTRIELQKMEELEKEIALMLSEDNVFRPIPIQSLLFTSWEHALLREAKAVFKTNIPSEKEIFDSQIEDEFAEEVNESYIREVSLGGLLYVDSKSWTLWLNKERVTPDGLPEEIMNIKVFNDYIELLWHDKKDNLLYPIRLRPHQRFNLDARLFIPG